MCGSVRALSGELVDGCPSLKPRVAATIGRYLVHIGWAYRMAGGDDPTATPLVRLELKAARKAVGTRQRQARAIRYKGDVFDVDGPASGICLDTLLKATRHDPLGDRDRAVLRVAYDTGCRRSELVAISVHDIEVQRRWRPAHSISARARPIASGQGLWPTGRR